MQHYFWRDKNHDNGIIEPESNLRLFLFDVSQEKRLQSFKPLYIIYR
jgi:hypothetical protein